MVRPAYRDLAMVELGEMDLVGLRLVRGAGGDAPLFPPVPNGEDEVRSSGLRGEEPPARAGKRKESAKLAFAPFFAVRKRWWLVLIDYVKSHLRSRVNYQPGRHG